MKNIVLYDLETTGRSSHWDQIIQIAAIHTDSNFKVLDKINLTGKLNYYCIIIEVCTKIYLEKKYLLLIV